jgi:hypothetical protein
MRVIILVLAAITVLAGSASRKSGVRHHFLLWRTIAAASWTGGKWCLTRLFLAGLFAALPLGGLLGLYRFYRF